jgi:hypothetical protein
MNNIIVLMFLLIFTSNNFAYSKYFGVQLKSIYKDECLKIKEYKDKIIKYDINPNICDDAIYSYIEIDSILFDKYITVQVVNKGNKAIERNFYLDDITIITNDLNQVKVAVYTILDYGYETYINPGQAVTFRTAFPDYIKEKDILLMFYVIDRYSKTIVYNKVPTIKKNRFDKENNLYL